MQAYILDYQKKKKQKKIWIISLFNGYDWVITYYPTVVSF